MPFHEIVNSTATIPYDVNDNFIYVAQGSITPKTGTQLEETTSVYNIGSSSYRWNGAYFNGTISCDTITTFKNTFLDLSEIELTASASKIDISGLNGDSYSYLIIASILSPDAGPGYIKLWFNGDSNTANYYNTYFYKQSVASNQFAYIQSYDNTDFIRNASIFKLNCKTGSIRKCFSNMSSLLSGENSISIYTNTTDTITSITIQADGTTFSTTTTIKIYKYGVA